MRRRISNPTDFSPALRRLGLASPPPFVGRAKELAALQDALQSALVLVVHGSVGAGKTRLAKQLASNRAICQTYRTHYIRCTPGDLGVALRARVERSLDAVPGTLAEVLRDEARLLIIDDVHNLHGEDAARTLFEMVREPGASRFILLTRDVLPLRRSDASRRFEITLDGLDEASARELWSHLEETYGPTRANTCDDALTRTRGMPLALRREYARAAAGDNAWAIDDLPHSSRLALEAIAVVRVNVAPAGVSVLTPDIDVEAALIDLVSRQLIDPHEDGRFSMHDIVRDEVFAVMPSERRVEMERKAAELVLSIGRGNRDHRRLGWDAGDDGALGLIHPVDRLREVVLHLINAGDAESAVDRLIEDREIATLRGGCGEVLALINQLEALDPTNGDALAGLRAEIAARQGRVAEALEIGGVRDEVDSCELDYLAGNVKTACDRLETLANSDSPDLRSRAAALLAEVALDRGDYVGAQSLATGAFERDRAQLGDTARARLHMALAAIEARAGRITSARAALSRAASSGRLPAEIAARIEARRATCLAREGRITEAERLLSEAEQGAREIDATVVSDELRRCRALVLARAGDAVGATAILRQLVLSRREGGNEIGALRAEIDLAQVLERRGELAAASELASACASSASRRKLEGLAARARLVSAAIDLGELRVGSARTQLEALINGKAADDCVRAEARAMLAQTLVWLGKECDPDDDDSEIRDDIETARTATCLALAAGDAAAVLDQARNVAVRAERAGRVADMAEALALVGRMQLARGDKSAATAAASRSAREALHCGLTRARTDALLVLAALARDEGDVSAAAAYAQDALALASAAGLPVQRLVAAQAMDVIADGDQAIPVTEIQSAAAATMSDVAIEAATRTLSDLGLTSARPYRLVSATGQESFVSDASPDLLCMGDRDLAVDGVREVIIRNGEQIADLRRRSLLKRLLFLFAAAPGRTFSKEDIVETVWEVEYHPLRHDAALFTNIMRIRRLLGKDGADLIRVSEEGYRFCPSKDFLFVEAVT